MSARVCGIASQLEKLELFPYAYAYLMRERTHQHVCGPLASLGIKKDRADVHMVLQVPLG